MTSMHVVVNALAQVTAWLALVWLATWLVRTGRHAVPWRVLLLRIGLAGVPVVLAVGLFTHALPWARPMWRVAPRSAAPAAAMLPSPEEPGRPRRAGGGIQSPLAPSVHQPPTLADRQGSHVRPSHVSPARQPAAPGAAGTTNQIDAGALPGQQPPAGPQRPAAVVGTAQPADGSGLLAIAVQAVVFSAGLVWLGGVLICGWRLGGGLVRLSRRRRGWRPVQNRRLRDLAARVAGRVGLRRPFRLLACDDLPMPVATGILSPAVVLPRDQFAHLATGEGRAVLAHELAHLRYHDPLWRMLGALLGMLLWFHPLMVWLNRRIEIEAEYQCDQAALGAGANHHRYARLLVGLAEMAWRDRPSPVAAIGAVHRTSHLERRLNMILSQTIGRAAAMGRSARWLALGVALVLVFSLSSVALLGEEGLDLEEELAAGEAPRPRERGPEDDRERPREEREKPANRVVVTLVNGRRIEGVWRGSSPDGLRVLQGDRERLIPLQEIVEIRMIRPRRQEGPPRFRRDGDREGERPREDDRDREGRPPREGDRDREGERLREGDRDRARLREQAGKADRRVAELNKALGEAEESFARARRRGEDDPERGRAIERAEQQMKRVRSALEEARRHRGRLVRELGERRQGRREDGPDAPHRPELNEKRRAEVGKLMEEAHKAVRAGQMKLAVEKFEQVVKMAPNFPPALRALAHAHRELGHKDRAEQLEKRLRAMEPPRRRPGLPPELAREREEIRARLAEGEKRMHAARELPEDHPERREALEKAERQLAEAREAAQRFEGKVRERRESAEKHRAHLREMARRADELARAGKWEAVRDVLGEMRELAPRSGAVLRALIRAYEELGMKDKAEQARRTLRELPRPRRNGDRPDEHRRDRRDDRVEGDRREGDRREGDRREGDRERREDDRGDRDRERDEG